MEYFDTVYSGRRERRNFSKVTRINHGVGRLLITHVGLYQVSPSTRVLVAYQGGHSETLIHFEKGFRHTYFLDIHGWLGK